MSWVRSLEEVGCGLRSSRGSSVSPSAVERLTPHTHAAAGLARSRILRLWGHLGLPPRLDLDDSETRRESHHSEYRRRDGHGPRRDTSESGTTPDAQPLSIRRDRAAGRARLRAFFGHDRGALRPDRQRLRGGNHSITTTTASSTSISRPGPSYRWGLLETDPTASTRTWAITNSGTSPIRRDSDSRAIATASS